MAIMQNGERGNGSRYYCDARDHCDSGDYVCIWREPCMWEGFLNFTCLHTKNTDKSHKLVPYEQLYICRAKADGRCGLDDGHACTPHKHNEECIDNYCTIADPHVHRAECIPYNHQPTTKEAPMSDAPKKLELVTPFSPYNCIIRHAEEYKGAACRAWNMDLEFMLQMSGLNQEFTGLAALQLDRPERRQLRAHLIKWGFVREITQDFVFVRVNKDDEHYNIECGLPSGGTVIIASVSRDGIRLYGGCRNNSVFATDERGRIKIVE